MDVVMTLVGLAIILPFMMIGGETSRQYEKRGGGRSRY